MQFSPDFVPMKPGEPGSSYNNPIDLTHDDVIPIPSPHSFSTPPTLIRQNTSLVGLQDPPINIGAPPNAPVRRQSTNGFNYSFEDEQSRDYDMHDPLFESEVLSWFSNMPLTTATQVLHRITRVISSNAYHNIASLSSSTSSSSLPITLDPQNIEPLNLRTPITPPRKRGHQDMSFSPDKEGFAPIYDEAISIDDNSINATIDVDDYSNEPGDSSDNDI